MKNALEELSFWIEDIIGLVWWVVRAFVWVLAISVGIIAAVGAVGWLLQVSLQFFQEQLNISEVHSGVSGALEAVAELLEIPEGGIPESGVVVISYMNPDGKQLVQFGFLGETSNVFQTIGTLETIKSHLTDYALEQVSILL